MENKIQDQIKEYLEWCEANGKIPNKGESLKEFCQARGY